MFAFLSSFCFDLWRPCFGCWNKGWTLASNHAALCCVAAGMFAICWKYNRFLLYQQAIIELMTRHDKDIFYKTHVFLLSFFHFSNLWKSSAPLTLWFLLWILKIVTSGSISGNLFTLISGAWLWRILFMPYTKTLTLDLDLGAFYRFKYVSRLHCELIVSEMWVQRM